MKRAILWGFVALLFLLLSVSPSAAQNTTGVNWGRGPFGDAQFWAINPPGVGIRWKNQVENLLGAGVGLGTGHIYYVDSGVAVAGAGTSWTAAKATLAGAIALCTANNGDIIYVAAGGGESLTGSVAVNKAGITIIGCGNGSDQPTYLYTTTDSALTVTVAGVTIRNLRFKPGVSAVVTAISLSAAADYFTLEDCEFVDPGTATYEFYDMVTLATGTDYCTIRNNRFISTVNTAGCNQAIDVDAGIVNRLTITNNEFQGNFAVAAIHSSRADTNALIGWNIVHQETSGQFAIEFTAAATGMCIDNMLYSDAYATTLDPGSLACFGNLAMNTVDLTAGAIPPRPAISTVTAGSADDILAKLYYAADGTGAYPATVANNSALAKILSKSGTAAASSFDNTTDSLEAISDKVTATMDTTAASHVTPATVGAMLQPLTSGTATAGSATTITLQSTASALADFYKGNTIQIVAGTGVGQSRVIVSYAVTSYIATVSPAWVTTPGATSVYVVYGNSPLQAGLQDPVYGRMNYLVVDPGVFDTSGVWSTSSASHRVLTITGACRVRCMVQCITTVTTASDTGTIALGVTGNTAALMAAYTLISGGFAGGDILSVSGTTGTTPIGVTPFANAFLDFVTVGGVNFGYTIATNALTGGHVLFHIWWTPLDSTGACVAGTGGAL